MRNICKISGCNEYVAGRGWCKKHYKNWYKYGNPIHVRRVIRYVCTVEGCNRKHTARGFCDGHYKAWRHENGKPCSVKGCSSAIVSLGLCSKHYQSKRLAERTTTCSEAGCSKKVIANGLCGLHYKQSRLQNKICSVDDCTNVILTLHSGLCATHHRREYGAPCSKRGCKGKAVARGLCTTHYYQWRKQHAPPCSITGCEKPASTSGLCGKHYSRLRSNGNPNVVKFPMSPSLFPIGEQPSECIVNKCDKPVMAMGLCTAHYKKKQLWADPEYSPYVDCPMNCGRRYRVSAGHGMCGECRKLRDQRNQSTVQPQGTWQSRSHLIEAGIDWHVITGRWPKSTEWGGKRGTERHKLGVFPGATSVYRFYDCWPDYIRALKRPILVGRAKARARKPQQVFDLSSLEQVA